RRINQFIRKLGRPPVIYDETLTTASAGQLRQALINRGYMDVSVEIDSILHPDKKKAEITYRITTGRPHFISTIDYDIPDSTIRSLILGQKKNIIINSGDPLDRNKLEQQRISLTEYLRNKGYYAFSKDCIKFVADTAANSLDVDLTMRIRLPYQPNDSSRYDNPFRPYTLRKVVVVTDYNPATDYGREHYESQDTVKYRGLYILYNHDHYLKPAIVNEACFLRPGQKFSQRDVNLTYEALGRLSILRYVNIDFRPVSSDEIDAYILLTHGKKQSISLELEGTNSEGDFGVGASITYQHRNLAKGSETLTTKIRGSYESLSGDFSGLINHHYMEYAFETGIAFPRFKAPFLRSSFKRKVKATTEFAVSFNYQERPEYTRIIAGGAWRYKWNNASGSLRHRYDLIDINYVRLPRSTIDFLNQIAPSNPLLRYSYEDHFIMLTGYTYQRTNKRLTSASSLTRKDFQRSIFALRVNVETAGNLLYLLSSVTGQHRNDGAYKIFGIQYAQYAKADADYTFSHNLSPRNSLSFHVGLGMGVPYANSSMIPFEKRFYAGGANGVRGWGVRTLGPGKFVSSNSVTDFINQCGDIRLYLSTEFRTKLFWVLEGALFLDAGNIWTIRTYENQPGGKFYFNQFYKQIAASYGCGLRMDFTYFLLRLDLGIKAHNPAEGADPGPLIHHRGHRDDTFHFYVVYPF
ncbi:MAG: BamA/TamA family outer membrane protein, partial [Muribaculum sp.]|nr:BamA/TamA family outer membrane protein [Muribaculum sp.]